MDVQKIRDLIVERKYEFSKHAEREREADMIPVGKLEQALRDCEIIEGYSDDPRGASCLVLGFCKQQPVHAVCTIKSNPEELFLITVYDPSKRSGNWTADYRKRR